MRRGEVLGLRWKDIDFNNNIIQVRQSIQPVTGKGLIVKEPKSGKARSISINEDLAQMLKQHKVSQNRIKLKLGQCYVDDDLVFPKEAGTKFYPQELTREFNKLVKAAGINKVRFHDLRHTHATLLLENGEHAKVVSERLGHSTIGITMDLYTHVTPNMQKQAAERFGDLLSAANIKH